MLAPSPATCWLSRSRAQRSAVAAAEVVGTAVAAAEVVGTAVAAAEVVMCCVCRGCTMRMTSCESLGTFCTARVFVSWDNVDIVESVLVTA